MSHTHPLPFDSSPEPLTLAPGVVLLRGLAPVPALLAAVERVALAAPFRHFVTPQGQRMSAAMTNCGPLGWISDRRGYRYAPTDPDTGHAWPALPAEFLSLARRAASLAGFPRFEPDACLVNRYAPGSQLTAHQDRNEADFGAPIVSVSLGLPAKFYWHDGATRRGPTRSVAVHSGDVLVWGGPARLMYHGVRPIRDGVDPLVGPWRINLTLRRAGPAPLARARDIV